MRSADALIAEVSVPSHGVGYEIGFALDLGKPVLCLHEQGRAVSKMITGNPHPNLTIRAYQTSAQAADLAREFASDAPPDFVTVITNLSVTFGNVRHLGSLLSYGWRRNTDTSNMLLTVSSFGECLRRFSPAEAFLSRKFLQSLRMLRDT